MTLQVETYEVAEDISADEITKLANEGEAQMLIEHLGLSGQKELFQAGDGSPVHHCYRAMTKEEHFVFKTLFPNETSVENYKDGPIPLRVLQIISHVRELNREDMAYIGVMHPEKFVDDPVLYAQKTSWNGTRYILARWGAALEPFADLREKAIKLATENASIKFRSIIREAQHHLEGIEDYVREKVNAGSTPSPHLHS